MQRIFTFILIILPFTAVILAQMPQSVSYQAVVRDADNNLVANQNVGLRIAILQGTANGSEVYSETFTQSTNANGLITVEIGGNTGLGTIDWSAGPYFIQTGIDPAGGVNYTITGTSQLLAVPYAMHARSAETIDIFDTTAEPGAMLYWDGSKWVEIPPGETNMTLTMCDGVPTWGPCPGAARVTVVSITGVTGTGATVNARVITDGGFEIVERGVVYSLNRSPTISDDKVTSEGGMGDFSVSLSGLEADSRYYVRAYVTTGEGTFYSPETSFVAIEISFGSVTDIENNEYRTVIIGTREWMAENLRTATYDDGTAVSTTWNQQEGAYAIYNNAYGKLYNWYAVDDERGLCPAGWRVPTDNEWTQMIDYIISNFEFGWSTVSTGLKSCRQVDSPQGGECNTTIHPRWNAHDTMHGTDDFGFSALPGGTRGTTDNLTGLGAYGFWWTSTESAEDPQQAWSRAMHNSTGQVSRGAEDKIRGHSIRCIKD
jgi:uncharacterized protein (TIGR02145 family)